MNPNGVHRVIKPAPLAIPVIPAAGHFGQYVLIAAKRLIYHLNRAAENGSTAVIAIAKSGSTDSAC